jgi:hypothetical protein
VALFFALEMPGLHARAVWAIDDSWCSSTCAALMAAQENLERETALTQTATMQAQLVSRFVLGSSPPGVLDGFKYFQGVLPVTPWMPDSRQGAQQGLFLCPSNVDLPFVECLAALGYPARPIYKLVVPGRLREQVLEQLRLMNISAATLFPDMGGLARSLRTVVVRPPSEHGDIWQELGMPPPNSPTKATGVREP